MTIREYQLVLADGETFDGEGIGAELEPNGFAAGEVVFNTVLSGYQESSPTPATPVRSSPSPTPTSATTA